MRSGSYFSVWIYFWIFSQLCMYPCIKIILFIPGHSFDLVRCFDCGIGLKDFSDADNPLLEHAKHSGNCPFLLEQFGSREALENYKVRVAVFFLNIQTLYSSTDLVFVLNKRLVMVYALLNNVICIYCSRTTRVPTQKKLDEDSVNCINSNKVFLRFIRS